jgi:hypothetical protein
LDLQPAFSVRVLSDFFAPGFSACAGTAETRPAVMPAMASWVSTVVFFMADPFVRPGLRRGKGRKLQSPGRRAETGQWTSKQQRRT